MTEPDESYGFAYPFTVCQSVGGPFEDKAFVSGCNFGELSTRTRQRQPFIEMYVDPALVPQIDLLAMHDGYTLTSDPWDEHPDEWTRVALTLATDLDGLETDHG